MYRYFLTFAFFLLAYVQGEVYVLDKLEDLVPFVDESTLVMFDIDDVLITPSVSWIWNDEFLQAYIGRDPAHTKGLKQIRRLRGQGHYKFVDNSFKQVLNRIHAQGGRVGCLTARSDRDPGLWEFLKTNAVQFSAPIPLNFFQNKVAAKNGIIFCSHQHKGESLFLVLKDLPKKIIFIDDRLNNCLNVYESCDKMGVECLSYHYTEADQLFDFERAKLHYHYWLETGILLPD